MQTVNKGKVMHVETSSSTSWRIPCRRSERVSYMSDRRWCRAEIWSRSGPRGGRLWTCLLWACRQEMRMVGWWQGQTEVVQCPWWCAVSDFGACRRGRAFLRGSRGTSEWPEAVLGREAHACREARTSGGCRGIWRGRGGYSGVAYVLRAFRGGWRRRSRSLQPIHLRAKKATEKTPVCAGYSMSP